MLYYRIHVLGPTGCLKICIPQNEFFKGDVSTKGLASEQELFETHRYDGTLNLMHQVEHCDEMVDEELMIEFWAFSTDDQVEDYHSSLCEHYGVISGKDIFVRLKQKVKIRHSWG